MDYLLEAPYDQRALPLTDRVYIEGTYTWNVTKQDPENTTVKPMFQLRDLALEFPKGQMTLIAGKFGSGKSLLLLALLGEARLVDGKVSYLVSSLLEPHQAIIPDWTLREGGVAYVPQVRCAKQAVDGTDCRLPGYRAKVFGRFSELVRSGQTDN